ncbi:MAG: serine/threonine-protein kinase [Polyangiaceae bacterium]
MAERQSWIPAIGTTFAGKYKLIQLLRSGGLAHVYLAERLATGPGSADEALRFRPSERPSGAPRIALKVLRRELVKDAAIVRRFERGVAAAAGVAHPNVAKLGPLETAPDGAPFCTMELLVGLDLADTLADAGRLNPLRAARIAEGVASALAAAHEAGVVHLDVKPENVFLVHRPDGGEDVKLIDFGLASHPGETRPEASDACGTPEYMAPEQRRGVTADPRMDVFALGLMLREMLTGEPPDSGAPLPPDVPARLVRSIRRATAREPADRFPTMADMEASLLVAIEEMNALESTPARARWR